LRLVGPLAQRLLAALMAGRRPVAMLPAAVSAALARWTVRFRRNRRPGRSSTFVPTAATIRRRPRAAPRCGRAFRGFNCCRPAVGGDPAGALATVDGVELLPHDANMRFLRTGALAGSGRPTRGRRTARVAERPTWEVVVRSFVAMGLIVFPPPASMTRRITRRTVRLRSWTNPGDFFVALETQV
jgi:hypothetical protein